MNFDEYIFVNTWFPEQSRAFCPPGSSPSWSATAKISYRSARLTHVAATFVHIVDAAFRPAIEFLRRPAVGNILDNLQLRWLDG